MIIAMANVKGGCSKSTTAVHLCAWLKKRGHSVALIDADVQATSSMWANALAIEGLQVVSIEPDPDQVQDAAEELNERFDYIVIDGPGGMIEVVRQSILVADLAVLPIQATGPDVRAAGEALKLLQRCRAIRKGEPPAMVFLSRVNKRTRAYAGARGALEANPVAPCLKGMISQKTCVADAYNAGQTVFDHQTGPGLESAREFDELFKEMLPNA